MERETCPCELCGKPTFMTGTKRCDACWELETRVLSNPELAQKILDKAKQS
jgi:ribosomal protein L37E